MPKMIDMRVLGLVLVLMALTFDFEATTDDRRRCRRKERSEVEVDLPPRAIFDGQKKTYYSYVRRDILNWSWFLINKTYLNSNLNSNF